MLIVEQRPSIAARKDVVSPALTVVMASARLPHPPPIPPTDCVAIRWMLITAL